MSNAILDALGMAGDVLDTPASIIRGLLSGDPGRAMGGVFDPSQRVSGKELLGLQDEEGIGSELLGMGAGIATDPLMWGGAALLKLLGRARPAVGAAKIAEPEANALLKAVGPAAEVSESVAPRALQAERRAAVAEPPSARMVAPGSELHIDELEHFGLEGNRPLAKIVGPEGEHLGTYFSSGMPEEDMALLRKYGAKELPVGERISIAERRMLENYDQLSAFPFGQDENIRKLYHSWKEGDKVAAGALKDYIEEKGLQDARSVFEKVGLYNSAEQGGKRMEQFRKLEEEIRATQKRLEGYRLNVSPDFVAQEKASLAKMERQLDKLYVPKEHEVPWAIERAVIGDASEPKGIQGFWARHPGIEGAVMPQHLPPRTLGQFGEFGETQKDAARYAQKLWMDMWHQNLGRLK